MSKEKDNVEKENIKNEDEVSNESEETNSDEINSSEEDTSKDDTSSEIDDLKDQLDKAEDKYLRSEAEINNIQNRNKKERAELLKYGGQKLAKDIVPIVDDLERALAVEVSDENGKQLKSGIELVFKHLEKALSENEVKEIDAKGNEFNPNLHQAVQTVAVDDDHPANTVVDVLQKGYMISDRVLRPAMVIVAQ
ncbi:nucleotide exchange factor GrpE [Lactobacillus sp. S2-2]|uniref:nucleotide exchange factor GrpE n=1 Tax=Lactobacillus sp. S2-2 TaxID=2692917 RepID=UPI001F2211C2|nr:nucleotide exchange factor GrpE [Lactobacillus sp. S2-2]MCF6514957.1 nucleotide exchange factor GrpE [Lactobacillus sp. S2-2]